VSAQDRELRYEWSFGNVFGRWPNEINGRSDREFLSEPDAAAVTALKRRVIEGGKALRERIRLGGGGQPKVYDLFLEPVTDASGAVTGITSVTTELASEVGS